SIEAAIEEAKKAIQEGEISKINSAVDRLTTASHKLAEEMYKQAGAARPGPQPGPESGASAAGETRGKPKSDGEVIDAEVVDDDKKKS
ncbi:MAG: molecular chaperone DnaK, partial [Acidobacteriia bacterium]|nr:molecular chaperone DnaK [Terriglobia bacterium]